MSLNEKIIWHQGIPELTAFNSLSRNTIAELLDIRFSGVGPDYLKATMPVDHRTHQPYGLLHGGASVVLAETIGSVASAFVIDHSLQKCVGMEVNANHLRPVRSGLVTATCTPLHLGSTTHVWDIKIHDDRNRLVCVARLTVAVLKG
jgi:1,4-dihydroxy-2-naphthoyl-CoA hydrolase